MDNSVIAAEVARLVRAHYVFADRGALAADAVEAGRYEGLEPARLCEAITADLRAACPDEHLSVAYRVVAGAEPDPSEVARQLRGRTEVEAGGVARVERLPGNVGYLDLRAVLPPELAGPAVTAALTLLAGTYALLLDLRHNTGGAPDGVAYLCSFFFGSEPVHLNDIHEREPGPVRQFWTLPYLPGPRYLDRPVYVLIGRTTFSGGEEIAYNLQQLGRGTLLGEVTRGGAHPVGEHWVHPHVRVRIPRARSVNPVSGTNWEGIGVQPDVALAAADAYDEAYARALVGVLARLGEAPDPHLRGVREEAGAALAQLGRG